MRRMEKVTGRSDDMIILRGVNVFPSQVEEVVLAIEALSSHYQLELGRDGAQDTLTVHVEAAPGHEHDDARAAAAAGLAERIKGTIGITVKANVTPVGGVVRSLGKAVRVVDNRPER